MVLRGAWSLDGGRIEQRLPKTRRDPSSSHRGLKAKEVLSGPLWLVYEDGCSVLEGTKRLAWEGFVSFGAEGTRGLSARMEGSDAGLKPASGPWGYYVAVLAEPDRDILTLLRDPTGGERLYFSIRDGVLFFATSIKALLALNPRGLDAETAFERGISEMIHFGDRTLVDGVREVLPGHRLSVVSGSVRQSWAWEGLLEPLEGDPPSLARALRCNLKDAVERCLAGDHRAAVALSGGADSASIAALAVDLLGPEKVSAFTYEYDDPGHPSEAAFASQVCRRLGIRDHRIFRITFDDFAGCVPEAVWLAEDPGYWKRSYAQVLAKAARAAGFDKFLTGFGIGSHLGYLEECSRALPWLPIPQFTLRYWRSAYESGGRPWFGRLHPGLEPPIHRLYHPLLSILRLRGLVRDLRPFYPPEIGSRVESSLDSSRVADEWSMLRRLPFAQQLRFHAFIHLNSCADVVRCERIAGEVGARWLGPAHFPACIPFCYLPLRTKPGLWDSRRRMRPGKLLLREAFGRDLPEEVFQRPKDWTQTIGSRAWRNRVLDKMAVSAGPSWKALAAVFGPALEEAKRFCPEGMIPLAFWHRVVLSENRSSPPSWGELSP